MKRASTFINALVGFESMEPVLVRMGVGVASYALALQVESLRTMLLLFALWMFTSMFYIFIKALFEKKEKATK